MEPDSRDIKQRLRDAKLELKKSKRKDYYKILGQMPRSPNLNPSGLKKKI